MRFGSQNRLHLARDIEFVKKNSAKTDCSAFVFYCLPRPDSKYSRIAIVASKKVGNAVVRTHARRIFREIFRASYPDFKMPADIMVFVRRNYDKFEFQKLHRKFVKAANKIIDSAFENMTQKENLDARES